MYFEITHHSSQLSDIRAHADPEYEKCKGEKLRMDYIVLIIGECSLKLKKSSHFLLPFIPFVPSFPFNVSPVFISHPF